MSVPRRNYALRGAAVAAVLLAGALLSLSGGGVARAAALPVTSVSIAPGSIAVTGASASGAVDVVTSASKGLKEPDTVLVLLGPGVTVGEFEAFLAANRTGDPNAVSRYGSIVLNAQARAGGTTEVQTMFSPGTYVAVNAEGQRSSKWASTAFIVTASATPAALPAPGAIERTIDFSFAGPTTLHRGELVRFENEGYVVHMDLAFPVRSNRGARKLVRALLTGREKAAEDLVTGPAVNFAGPLSSGGVQQARITATPGWYVQVCFMGTQDHRSHTLLGMERVIRIAA